MALLKKHSVWSIYDDKASSVEKFIQNFVPEMKLRKEVSQDVVKVYKVIRSLIIHSYYEYEFVDVAVSKLLQTFEMALKIRYRELNDKEWDSRKPLGQLIEWFRVGEYFENNDKSDLKHIREVRNYYSHPVSHSFGGVALLHWFDVITDRINDIYDDPDKRKDRQSKVMDLNNELFNFTQNGAIIDLVDEQYLIYELGILFIESGSKEHYTNLFFKTVFHLDKQSKIRTGQKFPLKIIQLNDKSIEIVSNKIHIGPFTISKLSSPMDKNIYEKWINSYNQKESYPIYDSFLNLELKKYASDLRRNRIHAKYFSS